jgi:MoaA/NifB/PqqE/SkfB family radical SAM enzyme
MANIAYLQITRACNQKCLFCSNPPSGRSDLTLTEAKKIIDGYLKKGWDGLIITGGEPTVYKHLIDVIKYCRKKRFPVRIITNGQNIADKKYLSELIKAGLRHFQVSIYSHKPKIQDFLADNPGSLGNTKQALINLSEFPSARVGINITINKRNSGHLSELVKFIAQNFPFVPHFVFNNLDPTSDRILNNPGLAPRLADFELELNRALNFLASCKKTFRVERVPLCYLAGFEYCSTETRKIVKGEVRPIMFLDEKGMAIQKDFRRKEGKAAQCKACFLEKICAGLFEMDKHYSSKELYPVFIQPAKIIEQIRQSEK